MRLWQNLIILARLFLLLIFIALSLAHIYSVRSPSPDQRFIRWLPPADGWVKLNSDGAFSSAMNVASCGGIVREREKCFLVRLLAAPRLLFYPLCQALGNSYNFEAFIAAWL